MRKWAALPALCCDLPHTIVLAVIYSGSGGGGTFENSWVLLISIALTAVHMGLWLLRAGVVALTGELRRESRTRFHLPTLGDAGRIVFSVLQHLFACLLVPCYMEGAGLNQDQGSGTFQTCFYVLIGILIFSMASHLGLAVSFLIAQAVRLYVGGVLPDSEGEARRESGRARATRETRALLL